MQEMSAGFSADKGAQEGRGVTSEKVDVIFYVVVNFSQNIKNNILIFSSTAAFDQRRWSFSELQSVPSSRHWRVKAKSLYVAKGNAIGAT